MIAPFVLSVVFVLSAAPAQGFFVAPPPTLDPSTTQKLLHLRDSIMNWTTTCDGQICNPVGVCDPATGQGNQGNGCLYGGETCFSSTFASQKYGGVACSGLKSQQDPSGRVWRNPVEAKMMKGYVGSFSRDEAIGTTLYIAATNDTEFALKWRNYIFNQSGYTCPEAEDSANNCVLMLDMMCNLNAAFGRASVPPLPMSMVHYLPRNWTAIIEEVIEWLKEHHWINETHSELRKILPENVLGSMKDDGNSEHFVRQGMNFAAELWSGQRLLSEHSSFDLCSLQGLFMLVSAIIAPTGFPLNLDSVVVMTRRLVGIADAWNDRVMDVVVERQPDNLYFRWIQNPDSAENVANVTQQLLQIAPYSEPAEPNEGWCWQRDTAQQAWLHSCGWDFVFMINVLTRQP